MSERNAGLVADPLFVGLTRPPMRWGVAYEPLLFNLVITMEIFVITRSLLALLIAVPIHGLCALLCARDPRFFHLVCLWGRIRLSGSATRVWRARSYSPLTVDLPTVRGRRIHLVTVHVADTEGHDVS